MSKLQQILDYILFIGLSNNSHGIHSPFVFDFYNEVLNVRKEYYFFGAVEGMRQSLLQNHTEIEMVDLGAGSVLGKTSKRRISSIAATSLQSPKQASLLCRIVDYFQPKTIIELGTSLGITTCYMAMPLKKSRFISIEGNPELSLMATSVCQQLGVKNVICKAGSFEEHLIPSLNELKQVDLMFFDGNHRYKPTWQYFTSALPYTSEQSVFIFDDIYWSKEMKDVWQQIKNHPQVTVTIDLYKLGLVFFRTGQRKQHFKLRI